MLLNALDAAEKGAEVLTRTACVGARREGEHWLVELEDRRDQSRRTIRARCVVNAAGPWVETVLGRVAGINSRRQVRLVKGSHIITPKFWEGSQAYLLQNTDKRVIFVNPYEGDKALIGTTDIPVEDDPAEVKAEPAEIDYLLAIVNRYFEHGPGRDDVEATFAGVRPLYDDAAENPSAVTRDYVFDVEPESPAGGRAPMLSVFGGKITTYRKLAEHALDKLAPFFPADAARLDRQGAAARRRHAGCGFRSLPCRTRAGSPLAARRSRPALCAALRHACGCPARGRQQHGRSRPAFRRAALSLARSTICAVMSGPRRRRTSSSGGPSIICT